MDKQVNYSMKGKAPIIILSVLFLNLALFVSARDFVMGVIDPYTENIIEMFNAIAMMIASIMFASFMFRGQRKARGSLPGACMIWGLLDIIGITAICIIDFLRYNYYTGYNVKGWLIAILLFIAFVMMMVSAVNRFENRALFFVSAGLGLMVQLYRVCTFYNIYPRLLITSRMDELVTLLFIIIFFLFGCLNRTVEVKEPVRQYVPVQSAPVAVPQYAPPAPVQSAPVAQPQNVAAASEMSNPPTVKLEPNGDLSPEYQLLFWKENFEKGMITESEYIQHRDEILREHFGK